MHGRLHFSQIFKGLEKDEIENLLKQVRYNIKNYPKGGLIISQGEKCENLFIILKGNVTTEMAEGNGNLLQVEALKAPQIFAPAFLFGERSRYPVNATASAGTMLLSFNKDSVLYLISHNQTVMTNYLDILSNKVQFLTERIRLFSMKTIRQKLESYILERLPHDSNIFIMDRTQKDLAEFFSVSRPALARVLGELKEEGIIKNISSKEMKVDKRRLETMMIK